MHKDTICTIVEAGDYIHVYCAKCGAPCTMDYKGMGLLIPQLEFICPNCGDLNSKATSRLRRISRLRR
jgi:hypothetical protein